MPFKIVRNDIAGFGEEAMERFQKLVHDVAAYIDETYIVEKKLAETGFYPKQRSFEDEWDTHAEFCLCPGRAAVASMPSIFPPNDLDALLEQADAGFSETLLKLIDRTGKKDSEIYKKAHVDRKLFSKIKNNPAYKPSKATALAFALALELDLPETEDFIRRAGYTLTHSSKFDIIVEYFIKERNYNLIELDQVLYHFDQPLIGS